MFGRQLIFAITFGALTAFNAGAAGSKNIETLLILRFLAGTIGSAPLTNAGGVIADMFSADERGLANALFATAPFLGPAVGPIAGGFLSQAKGWRWLQGLMAIFTGVLWILGSLWVPETYAVVILRRRAEVLSNITGHVYVSKFDVGHPNKALLAELRKALLRPWQLLFLEPIVLLCSIFQAVVFGTLYMMFAAFPIVFQQTRGWSNGVGGLAFLGVAIGMMFAVGYSGYDNIRYIKVNKSYDGGAPPEMRLPPALIGSVLLPIGLFWFAWTNGPNIHWIFPIVGSGFFAAGLVLVFLSLMNYLVDSYVIYAASVLAASSVLRSLFAAAFPLFTTNMYHSLGIHWASSVPAFLSLACVPFPFLFFRYGKSIRLRCKYAAQVA
ncbi:fluconazole resistance protein 1 [Colletotrichum tamarilloi]|uniref:Fluconazole resistance protein 1 n=1 Tax=Colletotrichum tamarilloi TaxID=1209934 RepID=A0ABQ9QJL8_9PEZI|nr:fluconazole resistance protein 1 [Colletotrichum tamarilloi]KAK1473873.1 fluconazole resistance protein 1 [Colletotrichum tamarilloi]